MVSVLAGRYRLSAQRLPPRRGSGRFLFLVPRAYARGYILPPALQVRSLVLLDGSICRGNMKERALKR